MISFAIALVFLSAILHVTWNVLIQSSRDPMVVATKAISLGVAVLTIPVFLYWIGNGSPSIPWKAWFWGLMTGVAELFYFMFLSYAYRHGQLSIVYPIARGSAPIVSVLLGLFLLQEPVGEYQVLGVIFLIIGIWLVRSIKTNSSKGVAAALLTGVFIAAYTVIDKVALDYVDAIIFCWLKFFFTAVCLLAWIPVRKMFNIHALSEEEQGKADMPFWKIALIGVCLITTYQLVLFALETTPVAIVSPLRESASVIVTAWGIWKLNEREGKWQKILGVLIIFAGIVLLTLQ